MTCDSSLEQVIIPGKLRLGERNPAMDNHGYRFRVTILYKDGECISYRCDTFAHCTDFIIAKNATEDQAVECAELLEFTVNGVVVKKLTI